MARLNEPPTTAPAPTATASWTATGPAGESADACKSTLPYTRSSTSSTPVTAPLSARDSCTPSLLGPCAPKAAPSSRRHLLTSSK